MNIWIWVLIFLGAGLFIFMIYGLLLPGKWKVETSILLKADQEKLWAYLNTVRNWEEWTIWNRESNENFSFSYEGPEEGKGATQNWKARRRKGHTVILGGENPNQIDYEFGFGAGQHRMCGTIILESVGTDIKVIWNMAGDAGPSPNRRIIVRMMRSYMEKDFERGLQRLKEITQRW